MKNTINTIAINAANTRMETALSLCERIIEEDFSDSMSYAEKCARLEVHAGTLEKLLDIDVDIKTPGRGVNVLMTGTPLADILTDCLACACSQAVNDYWQQTLDGSQKSMSDIAKRLFRKWVCEELEKL